MVVWEPWRGCHRYSEGCKFCYIHMADYKRNIDTNNVVKTKNFDKIIQKNKKGEYKVKSKEMVYVCFSSDFLIDEADDYRDECWKMIKERQDLTFLFLTKRIERFTKCIPDDWNDGYDNVIVGVSIENQKNADFRLSIFNQLPIKHKNIICQPLIEPINLAPYLKNIELVVVGGESHPFARPLNYDWVLDIREQCILNYTPFEFRQCGTNFIKEGRIQKLATKDLIKYARSMKIDFKP